MNITLTTGKKISIAPDASILESLKKAGIYLNSSCGGKGTCGKCKVIVKSGNAVSRSKIKLSQEEKPGQSDDKDQRGGDVRQ